MSNPLTADEQNEILTYINRVDPENERIHVDTSHGGWVISIHGTGNFVGWLHPRTFLDIIRTDDNGKPILK